MEPEKRSVLTPYGTADLNNYRGNVVSTLTVDQINDARNVCREDSVIFIGSLPVPSRINW